MFHEGIFPFHNKPTVDPRPGFSLPKPFHDCNVHDPNSTQPDAIDSTNQPNTSDRTHSSRPNCEEFAHDTVPEQCESSHNQQQDPSENVNEEVQPSTI